jgi:hypothetical protein
LNHEPHFKELIAWADKTDAAQYSSVKEATDGDAPARRIARSLSADDQSGPDYGRFLLDHLRDHDLAHVAALEEVKSREDRMRRSILSGLESVRAKLRLEKGGVAVFDRAGLVWSGVSSEKAQQANFVVAHIVSPSMRKRCDFNRSSWCWPSIVCLRFLTEEASGNRQVQP